MSVVIKSTRKHGLDWLKFIACMIVVWSHFKGEDYGWISRYSGGGMLANGIFSTISGYLLAEKPPEFRWRQLADFFLMVWIVLGVQVVLIELTVGGVDWFAVFLNATGFGLNAQKGFIGQQYWYVGLVVLFFLLKWIDRYVGRVVMFCAICVGVFLYRDFGGVVGAGRFFFCMSLFLLGVSLKKKRMVEVFAGGFVLCTILLRESRFIWIPPCALLLVWLFEKFWTNRCPWVSLTPYVWLFHGTPLLIVGACGAFAPVLVKVVLVYAVSFAVAPVLIRSKYAIAALMERMSILPFTFNR